MERTLNNDGSWNWDALEQHFAGELTRDEIKAFFTHDAPPPEETVTVELFPTLTDEQLVEWLTTVELRQRPTTVTDPYILWRLQNIRRTNPVLYATFKIALGNL